MRVKNFPNVFSYSELWSVRLSVRTQAFHACKRGSIPLRSTKFMDLMCQLPEAGMKLPNSIGGRSGLDSHCGPPSFAPGVMVALQVSIERYTREAMRGVQGSIPCGAIKF